MNLDKKYEIEEVYSRYIAMSRYARYNENLNRRETWEETVERLCSFWMKRFPDVFPYEEIKSAVLNMEVMPSMRSLMTAGEALERDEMAAYNPVVGWTRVVTKEFGNVQIKNLNQQVATVLNKDGKWTKATFNCYGRQPLYRVDFVLNSNTKKSVVCTADHRWVLKDGQVVPTIRLEKKDAIDFVSAPKAEIDADYKLGIMHGIIYGDGTAAKSCERVAGYHIRLCDKSRELLWAFEGYPVTYPKSYNGDPVIMMYDGFASTHQLKELPSKDESESYLLGFIRGWFAADGFVSTTSQVSICSAGEGVDWLRDNCERLGFVIQNTERMPSETNYGKRRNESWRVTFSRSSFTSDDILPSWKKERFRPLKSTFYVQEVHALEDEGEVYCAEVPETNTFVLEGGLVTGNCSFLAINDPRCFDEVMYILMCGTGVGFSVERQEIQKLPIVAEEFYPSETIIKVSDSKIGWCSALRELVSLLYSGHLPKWDLSKLRPAGARLKTFGGRSSGPGPLNDVFNFFCSVFKKAAGRKLTSLECHDLVCKIAEAVVVGGVRRSALISLSNLSDERMRDAKTGQWWETQTQRALANNSAAYTEKPDIGIFMKEWLALYNSKSGERGIFNRIAAKKKVAENGRRDPNFDFGTNPCGEILLRSFGLCNLSEAVVRYNDTLETLIRKVRLATILGTFQSSLTAFRYVRSIWRKNAEEERLLGVSLTGIMDNITMSSCAFSQDKEVLEHWLKTLKQVAIDTNKEWAEKLGINPSAAITTVKPSGCQKADTLVQMQDGIFKLNELGNINGKQWQSLDKNAYNGRLETAKATQFFNNGVAKTVKLKMKSGLTLECTPNHRYKVLQKFETSSALEWKAAEDIKIGEVIPYSIAEYTGCGSQQMLVPVPAKHNCLNKVKDESIILDSDLAWVLGLYFGDGSNHKKGIRIAGSIEHLDHLEKAAEILEDKLGLKSVIYHHGIKNADLYINSTHFVKWLIENGISKQKSHLVEIPLKIRQSNEVVLNSFIDGYCAADGVINHLGRAIVTTSKIMAEQLVTVLRLIGKDASMREMPPTDSSWGNRMRYWIQEKKGLAGDFTKLPKKIQEDISRLRDIKAPRMMPDYVVEISEGECLTLDIEVPNGNTYLANSYISHNTVSQLVNSSSGIHPRYSKQYIRTVRSDKKDPLATFLMIQGVPVEDDVTKPDSTYVFSFPMASPNGVRVASDVSAIEQLELYLNYRRHWAEHNISITVYVRENEWMDVGAWVYKHFDELCGVSFLPYSDHVYKQAPYQPISLEEYNIAAHEFPDINWNQFVEYEDNTKGSQELACSAGSCEII